MNWLLFILISSVFNALWGALGKNRIGELSSIPFSFIFRGFTVLFFLPLFMSDFRPPMPPRFWVAATCAGVINAVVTILVFEGIRRDFYSTFSLRNTTPIFTWFLAMFILKESFNIYVALGVLLTAAGALLFYRARQFSMYGLSCALLGSVSAIFSKVAIDLSSPLTYPFVLYVVTIITLGLLILFRRKERRAFVHTLARWKTIFPLSCLSFLAILNGFTALKMAPVSWVVPVGRMRLLFAFGLSYLYLHEKEDWKLRLLAGCIILVGTILIAFKARLG